MIGLLPRQVGENVMNSVFADAGTVAAATQTTNYAKQALSQSASDAELQQVCNCEIFNSMLIVRYSFWSFSASRRS